MYNGYKVIVLIPGGRRRYLRALLPYLFSNKIIDNIQIVINTPVTSDIDFICSLETYDNRVVVLNLPDNIKPGGNAGVNFLYKHAVDNGSIYIKVDDDVVWIDDNAILNIIKKKIEYENAFLVSPIIINNTLCAHMLQKNRKLDFIDRYVSAIAGGFPYTDAHFTVKYHKYFIDLVLKNSFTDLMIEDQIFACVRFSINFICFTGNDMKKLNGNIERIWRFGIDDEEYLSVHAPAKLHKYNVVCGNAIAAHHSFFPQVKDLNNSTVLYSYQTISKEKNFTNLFINKHDLKYSASIINNVSKSNKSLMFISFPLSHEDFFCNIIKNIFNQKYYREFFNFLCNKKYELELKKYCGNESNEGRNKIFSLISSENYKNLINSTWKNEQFSITKDNFSPLNIINYANDFCQIALFTHRSIMIPSYNPILLHSVYESFLLNTHFFPALENLQIFLKTITLDSAQKEVIAHLVHWYTTFKNFDFLQKNNIQANIPILNFNDFIDGNLQYLTDMLQKVLIFDSDTCLNIANKIVEQRKAFCLTNSWLLDKQNIYTSMDIESFYQKIFNDFILKYDIQFKNSIFYPFLQ